MKCILLGSKVLDFTAQDGSKITGSQLYVAFESDDVQGRETDRIFVRENVQIPKLEIGKTYNLFFNRKGKVEQITLAN